MTASILVVDDDPGQRRLLAGFLEQQGYTVHAAASGAEALAILEGTPVDLVVSDVRMPGMSGIEFLRRARTLRAVVPVIMVTAFAHIRDAVQAIRDGALNYLEKPIDLDELRDVVQGALGSRGASRPAAEPEPPLQLPEGLIAESPAMRDALREATLVAAFDSRVLLLGESGTGKEVVARLIHGLSPRSRGPMVCVNCAAIPEALLESELFGHERGAFTGAVDARKGRFEEADGGSMFLDEVSEMPPALQAKLLRVIQDGTFQRLGANRERHADVRLIAATNRDLEEEVVAGRFREDLFYRLNVIEIRLPPLRERPADILPLANLFAARYGGGRHRLSPAVAASLALHSWPGNVRELQNAMERAVLMARGGVILPEHLPRRIQDALGAAAVPHELSSGRLQDLEDLVILQTLREHRFNRTETARALGISRRALIYKLRRLEEAGHSVNP
ncbi:MAG: sigma-54-dependent Fis family transcriptional regulator [Lentisphaeria bacterium]|nr:sigma-54-dependent Fis family transcriptional regulator [Lentisphaeria bacterium]